VLSACTSEDEPTFVERALTGKPTQIKTPAPRGTDAGRNLVAASGCLACHRVGGSGNTGPGSDLTHVGKRLPGREIARVLVDPLAPMPSYESLPARDRAEIVRYLAALR
jgi:ubiquinol-cytochrome c reductase cytochrome b subunit/menaquinol-cytochrome c reductase cytochrome b/c subunit